MERLMANQTERVYDLIIIGGGPSGLTAGMYAARSNMDVLLLEKGLLGGVLQMTYRIDNYLGYPDGVAGADLAMHFEKHLRNYVPNENIRMEWVKELTIDPDDDCLKIVKTDKNTYKGHTVIIGTGSTPKHLPVKGSDTWIGRGLSYCAVCDGAFFNGKALAVVGGGNAAIEEGMFLTRFATEVTIIHRRDELRATPILQQEAFNDPKMKIMWDTVVVGLHGEPLLEELELENVKTKKRSRMKAQGIFIYIGSSPNTDFVKIDGIKVDELGYFCTDEFMCVGKPGVFATGDVRAFPLRQISISCGNGAVASLMAERYIHELKREKRYKGTF
jgi:thioredoxin reductase (NADPH)